MNRAVDLLDSAIGTIKNATGELRHDHDVLPSDLSAVIGTLRELTWTIDQFTGLLTAAYEHQHDIGHDNNADPVAAVERVTCGLTHARRHLAAIDALLGDTHNTAAKLHRH